MRGRLPGGQPVRSVSRCQGRQDCSYNSPPGGSTCRCRGLEQRCPLLSAATAADGGYAGCQPVSELPCNWWTAGLVNARAAAHDNAPILRCAKRPGQSALRSYCRSRRRRGASSQWYDFSRLGLGHLVRPAHPPGYGRASRSHDAGAERDHPGRAHYAMGQPTVLSCATAHAAAPPSRTAHAPRPTTSPAVARNLSIVSCPAPLILM